MSPQPIAVLLALLFAAAAHAAPAYERPMNGDCIAMSGTIDLSTGLSLYPDQFMLVGDEADQGTFFTEVTSALGFTVKYYPTYKVVNNTIAGEVYVLYQCGASPPARTAFPEGTGFFQVPLTSISAPETVPYAFLANLGVTDRVHDVSPYITAPCGQALLECEGRTSPDYMALSNVTLLEETVSPLIDGMLVTTPSDYEKSFTLSAAQDPGVLNRAEWIKFVGLFFNREREASAIFDAIKAEYEATEAAARTAAAAQPKTPVVAWAQHFIYDPSEYYQLSFAPYQAQLTDDAGGAMLDRDSIKAVPGVQGDPFDPSSPNLIFAWGLKGSFATKEEAKQAFIDALKQADIIIDETYTEDPTTYSGAAALEKWGFNAADLAEVPAAVTSRIFREDGLVSFEEGMYGLDWFESAIARPGRVLADLVRIVHLEITQDASFIWFRNLFTEKPVVVGAEACEAKASCTAEPAIICPFVKLCGEGLAPAILESGGAQGDAACSYAACGKPLALEDGGEIDALVAPAPAPAPASTNAAAMAAPAVVLTLVVVAFVEVMMHFC